MALSNILTNFSYFYRAATGLFINFFQLFDQKSSEILNFSSFSGFQPPKLFPKCLSVKNLSLYQCRKQRQIFTPGNCPMTSMPFPVLFSNYFFSRVKHMFSLPSTTIFRFHYDKFFVPNNFLLSRTAFHIQFSPDYRSLSDF